MFTSVEGVPGIWFQHVGRVLRSAPPAGPLTGRGVGVGGGGRGVAGQGLGDVVHTVHLQTGLVWGGREREGGRGLREGWGGETERDMEESRKESEGDNERWGETEGERARGIESGGG